MMRRPWLPTALFVFAIIFLLAGFLIKWPDFQNKPQVEKVLQAPTVLDLRLTIAYAKPPIYQEQYVIRNNNGLSTAQYKITGYSGKVVTITIPPAKRYDMTFFFEDVVADGIWQLTNRPPRGNTDVRYTLYVHEIANRRQGSRTITFTDPHYWAVTAGRQYEIHLSPNSPTPDLLKLQSTTLADPRFEKIVRAFRSFGPASFRQKILQAQQLVTTSH
jgi:hypothetical protein